MCISTTGYVTLQRTIISLAQHTESTSVADTRTVTDFSKLSLLSTSIASHICVSCSSVTIIPAAPSARTSACCSLPACLPQGSPTSARSTSSMPNDIHSVTKATRSIMAGPSLLRTEAGRAASNARQWPLNGPELRLLPQLFALQFTTRTLLLQYRRPGPCARPQPKVCFRHRDAAALSHCAR